MGTAGGDSGEGAVYNFFRNLRSAFGIPHRLEPGDQNRREKALTPSQDMYDDTSYAGPNSFVQEYDQKGGSSGDHFNNADHQKTRPGRGMFPFRGGGFNDDNHGFDPFGFGSIFGQMDTFFSEMERAFEDMNKHFDGFVYPEGGDDRPHGFGLFNDPIMDREEISGEDRERNKLTPYGQPNLRGEVLKPGNEDEGPEGSSNTDGLTESNGTRVQPRQFFNWSSNTGTYTSDGSKAYSQTIRDTPKGREITTFRQNPDGTSEKSTEFIPREDIASHAGPEIPEPFGFIRDFFRPRM